MQKQNVHLGQEGLGHSDETPLTLLQQHVLQLDTTMSNLLPPSRALTELLLM